MTVVTIHNQNIQNKFSTQNFILFVESLNQGQLIPRPRSTVAFNSWDKETRILDYNTTGKYIREAEFSKALKRLYNFGFINKEWFEDNINSANSMPCNYTTMGGLFILYGLVVSKCSPACFVNGLIQLIYNV